MPKTPLEDLPPDVLRQIFRLLADPFAPASACALVGCCRYTRSAFRSRATSADRTEVERLRLWWGRATAFCGSHRTTASHMRLATTVGLSDSFAVAEAPTLALLLERGSFRRLCWLQLYGSLLSEASLRPIIETLAAGASPSLKSLDLAGNHLGDVSCAMLAQRLGESPARVLPALEVLGLGSTRISSRGVEALARALARGAMPRLVGLGLRSNDIDDEGVIALAESGMLGLAALRELFLCGNNRIKCAGIDALASRLLGGSFPSLRWLDVPPLKSSAFHAACAARCVCVLDTLGPAHAPENPTAGSQQPATYE